MNKIHTINMYALPVIRYQYSELPKEEPADVKTQKLLMKYRSFHAKSNTQRLYTSQKEGGRSLVSLKATLLDKTQSIHGYISKMALKDELVRECLRQQQTREEDPADEVPWQDKTLHEMYH